MFTVNCDLLREPPMNLGCNDRICCCSYPKWKSGRVCGRHDEAQVVRQNSGNEGNHSPTHGLPTVTSTRRGKSGAPELSQTFIFLIIAVTSSLITSPIEQRSHRTCPEQKHPIFLDLTRRSTNACSRGGT